MYAHAVVECLPLMTMINITRARKNERAVYNGAWVFFMRMSYIVPSLKLLLLLLLLLYDGAIFTLNIFARSLARVAVGLFASLAFLHHPPSSFLCKFVWHTQFSCDSLSLFT
jgi:hypothetical protein